MNKRAASVLKIHPWALRSVHLTYASDYQLDLK